MPASDEPTSDNPAGDEGEDPTPAHGRSFVPEGFVPPEPPATEALWLEPLGPQHNDADYAAWTSSVEHIHATAGFSDKRWPHPMTLDENLADLQMHARHFARGQGFTYTVRETTVGNPGTGDVIGCVYIYPSKDPATDADVRSWVRVSHAELDPVLYREVSDWLEASWPFETVAYVEREPSNGPSGLT